MNKIIHYFAILFLVYEIILPKVHAGNEGGGSQGVVDAQTGRFRFVDALSLTEKRNIVTRPASEINIITDIQCTDSLYYQMYYRVKDDPDIVYEIWHNDAFIPDIIKSYHKYKALDTNYESPHGTDILKYERLISKYNKFLKSVTTKLKLAQDLILPDRSRIQGYSNDYFGYGAIRLYTLDDWVKRASLTLFRLTALPIRQVQDATEIGGIKASSQIQIAYYDHGHVYFQLQALDLLDEKEIVGVFIKEILRYINGYELFNLTDNDLELTTFTILNIEENQQEFKQSLLAKKWMQEYDFQLALDAVSFDEYSKYSFNKYYTEKNVYTWNLKGEFIEYQSEWLMPDFLKLINVGKPNDPKTEVPKKKLWNTSTGDLVDASECKINH